jgi:hypothetical protein
VAESYIDIIRSKWNAQPEDWAEELISGASVERFVEHRQRKIDHLWQLVIELEPGPDEDPQLLTAGLKQLPREIFLPEFFDCVVPALDLAAEQAWIDHIIKANRAQMRAASERIMREWDSRVDARMYSYEGNRTKTKKRYARWRSMLQTLEEQHPSMNDLDYAKEIYKREKAMFGESRSVDTIRRKMRPGRK